MPKIYSNDLKEKIYECYKNDKYTYKEMTAIFGVSVSLITSTVNLFKKYGEIKLFTHKLGRKRIISKDGEEMLKKEISANPSIILKELQKKYQNEFGKKVSLSTIFYKLKDMNYSYKKNSRFAIQKLSDDVKKKQMISKRN